MKIDKIQFVIMASVLFIAVQARASVIISSLDTGAGQYSANNGAVLTDPNWTVSLLAGGGPTPPVPTLNGTPPGGIPNAKAYLVPNNIGFPFGYWLANTSTSSWITYSTPTQLGSDMTGGTYQYQLRFTAESSGTVDVTWLSDNTSFLYVNNILLGTKPNPVNYNPNDYSPFASWNTTTPGVFTTTAGYTYTVDLDVYNIPQSYGNPTGARVEFVDPVNPSFSVNVVPEPTTIIAGVLLLLPFGASTLRILRRNRAA